MNKEKSIWNLSSKFEKQSERASMHKSDNHNFKVKA